VTLFSLLAVDIHVNAERLYELDNLYLNGDFSNGMTSWSSINYTSLSTSNGFTNGTFGTSYAYSLISQSYKMISDHKYYYNFTFNNTNISSNDFSSVRAYVLGTNHNLFHDFTYFSGINKKSGIYESEYDENGNILIGFYKINNTTSNLIGFGNIIFLDLTTIFGSGYEPSLTDFELYFLPDLDYFDTFNSFEPSTYTYLDSTYYTDLGTDLTSIDYTKSVIDNYGKNINLDLNAYFYDTTAVIGGETITIPGEWNAQDYVTNNHPIMLFNGVEYTLDWVVSDYSAKVLHLDLDDDQELILKKILFNRNIDPDNEYFQFDVTIGLLDYVSIWFSLGSKFDLLVDIESFMISRETKTLNDFNVLNFMIIKCYDQDDNLLLPSLKLNIGDLFKSYIVDDFGSSYSNISKFNFEFDFKSPSEDDAYTYEEHYFYEIGIFSSDKVLHVTEIDSDLDSLWNMKTCDWYQIGCHLSNFTNELLTSIYNKLQIGDIIAFFDNIFDDVSQVFNILPDGVITVLIVLFSGLGVAMIVVIIERMNR